MIYQFIFTMITYLVSTRGEETFQVGFFKEKGYWKITVADRKNRLNIRGLVGMVRGPITENSLKRAMSQSIASLKAAFEYQEKQGFKNLIGAVMITMDLVQYQTHCLRQNDLQMLQSEPEIRLKYLGHSHPIIRVEKL